MQEILSNYSEEIINKAMKIKAVITDVDGVLTDGKITYDSNGVETKSFNVKDGLIVKKLKECGILVGLITGRSSSIVQKRSEELGFDFCYQGSKDKLTHYKEIKDNYQILDEEVAYLGDDINDLPLIVKVGLGVVPLDTMDYMKQRADMVSSQAGGNGVLREAADLILASKGEFDKFLEY